MTPKEKARDLASKYGSVDIIMNYSTGSLRGLSKEEAVRCAKIAVDEMIDENKNLIYYHGRKGEERLQYLQEVKQELEKL